MNYRHNAERKLNREKIIMQNYLGLSGIYALFMLPADIFLSILLVN